MATATTPERKPNPNAPKPKQNLLMIGGILIALGALWFGYDLVRPLTPEELREKKDEEQREAEMARERARDERKR